jgi:hypothetical protein
VPQNSRKFERSGKLARRRRRTNARLMRSVPVPPPSLLMAKIPAMLLPLVTNKLVDPFNSHPSATNLALKFLVNTKLPLAVFNSCRSTATTIFNILATQLLLMALQTRCTVNVITPSFCNIAEFC